MTRKDYFLIAEGIKASGLDKDIVERLIKYLSISFQKDNERFDLARFREACFGETSSR